MDTNGHRPATADEGQTPPIVVPPARHRRPDGGLSIDPNRTLLHARRRFADQLAIAESEAALWQAAYDELNEQRVEEVTALSTRLAAVEAEHSAALSRIIDLELAAEGRPADVIAHADTAENDAAVAIALVDEPVESMT